MDIKINIFAKELLDKIVRKVDLISDRIKDTMPYTTKDGIYNNKEDNKSWWTNTFWCGILWMMYKETGNQKYMNFAKSIEEKMDSVLYNYDELDHDVGFMWLLSSVYNYEITGDTKSKSRAMLAASVLASRANIKEQISKVVT